MTNGAAPPRVALVAGASSRIGQACLRRLQDDGFLAVGGWRSEPADGRPAVRFDVTDHDEVRRAVAEVEERWGPVHVLVDAAGRAHLDLAARLPPHRFRKVVDTDLTGSFLLARAVLDGMLRRRAGRIVLVGSAASGHGVPGVAAYAAAKAGLDGLVRSIAREVGRRSVTVNVVAPGLLEDAVDRIDEHRPRSGADDAWLAATPAGRAGRADEVAATVAFLASDRAGAVTGATVAVDGGFAMGLG